MECLPQVSFQGVSRRVEEKYNTGFISKKYLWKGHENKHQRKKDDQKQPKTFLLCWRPYQQLSPSQLDYIKAYKPIFSICIHGSACSDHICILLLPLQTG